MEITEYKVGDTSAKTKSSDRIIVIARKDGANTLSSKGLIDNRLFTGENKLHAVFNPENMMWYLKFDSGLLPPAFKQHFTSFSILLKFVKDYYEKRNIEVKEIID